MGNPFNVIHPHISRKTEGFIPAAVDASYIILIDLQANNTSRLIHNRRCGQEGRRKKKKKKESKKEFPKRRREAKVNYVKPQSHFDCYSHLIFGVVSTELNLFWHLVWGLGGFSAHRKFAAARPVTDDALRVSHRGPLDTWADKSAGIIQRRKRSRWARKKRRRRRRAGQSRRL